MANLVIGQFADDGDRGAIPRLTGSLRLGEVEGVGGLHAW
jgi:hypothetical protein